ncbi:molybdate ABC transporter substrate-binding protein [Aestuariirhabdus litorea]|uniref:Molybdate ABC transporter substrate-binding protein n=2 Tax=Aestuariirhabdus litorea TaxID=2528527 RepID=A0A3P3VLJ6_9GAMM|nr:molybdate ABC transporter substrate-binding protein [Aestuariirhabdus litorea]RWW93665.1 molybdate ABC transporter substrate-binding protein [Endozoicomonadaceae bacterium GTF-13]
MVALLLCLPVRAEPVLVAAASSLKFALEEVLQGYQAEGKGEIQLVFGSSGNFYRQIRQSAPYQLYLSADESYVQQLQRAGLTEGEGVVYCVGRLAYFAPTGSRLQPEQGVEDLRRALEEKRLTRFAIANPAHAPYGRAAREVLQRLQLMESIGPYLVMGENVSQATQFATSGATDGGLIAYSLAVSPPIAARGRYSLVPDHLYQPLLHRAVLIKGAGAGARSLYTYLQSEAAKRVFARHGFGL